MEMLTQKQEVFAQAIAEGLNQSAAYRKAYNADYSKAETVQANACRLMANSKIKARVFALRDAYTQSALWTREMSVKALIDAIELAQSQGNASSMVSAIKELNAMYGLYAPKQLDINHEFVRIERVIVKP